MQICIFSEKSRTMIDLADIRKGVAVGQISGETIYEIRNRWPDAKVGDLEDVVDTLINQYVSPAIEITQEEFLEALEVLPPKNWVHKNAVEMFQSSEHLYGPVTGTYVRMHQTYYMFYDMAGISIQEAMDKIFAQRKFAVRQVH